MSRNIFTALFRICTSATTYYYFHFLFNWPSILDFLWEQLRLAQVFTGRTSFCGTTSIARELKGSVQYVHTGAKKHGSSKRIQSNSSTCSGKYLKTQTLWLFSQWYHLVPTPCLTVTKAACPNCPADSPHHTWPANSRWQRNQVTAWSLNQHVDNATYMKSHMVHADSACNDLAAVLLPGNTWQYHWAQCLPNEAWRGSCVSYLL